MSGPRIARSPIILVGALRSGTTMLRLMLRQHSRIAWSSEFEQAVAALDEEGWPPLADYYRYLETHRPFLRSGFTIDRSLEYPDLVRDFLRQKHEADGRPEVAITIHSNFHRCPDLWPDARYVHLLRDPRDVARSCVVQGWAGNTYHGVGIWLEAERRWDLLVERTRPEQRYELRYEDLVEAPERELAGLCDFLGLEYEEAMLRYDEDSTYSRPDPRLASQWKQRMSRRELARLEARCGSLLSDRGYSPSASPSRGPGRVERLALYGDHRFRRALGGIRRYGPRLWIEARLARLVGSKSYRKAVKLRQNAIDLAHLK